MAAQETEGKNHEDGSTSGLSPAIMLLSSLIVCLLFAAGESRLSGRIVNGIVAEPNSWPWQLSLQLDNSHICGAVVLNENFALTAAHCVDFDGYAVSRFSVVCGAHDILKPDSNWQVSTAAAIVKHENYDPNANGFPNDIAVIRLSTPLVLGPTCQPSTLPPDNSNEYANLPSTITGWGRLSGTGNVARFLKQAAINTITYSECRSLWGIFFNPVRTTNICVLDPTGVHGACNGDSGGPLFTPDPNTGKVTVTGLTSFGRSGCDTSYPSVYTRVSSYLSWISATLASM
ncbi:fibrinolytic enzyme, isozyme C-like [Babylonia areolata]|uniref:fibrinolytic enzyme, isozyme C-like n=1 Tax=Babylonia areolata TaxID=304850 RepID=UPI003FD57967